MDIMEKGVYKTKRSGARAAWRWRRNVDEDPGEVSDSLNEGRSDSGDSCIPPGHTDQHGEETARPGDLNGGPVKSVNVVRLLQRPLRAAPIGLHRDPPLTPLVNELR